MADEMVSPRDVEWKPVGYGGYMARVQLSRGVVLEVRGSDAETAIASIVNYFRAARGALDESEDG